MQLTEEELTELRESFEYNDANRDGSIEFDEFVDMLDDLEANVSHDEACVGFEEIDSDRDGWIDFDEFIAWWRSP